VLNFELIPSEKLSQESPEDERCRERRGGLLKYYSYAA
jgi:hypothetical protein